VDEHSELGVAIPITRRQPLGGDRVPPLRERDDDDEAVQDGFKLNCLAAIIKRDGVY